MRKSKEQRFIERISPGNPEAWPGYIRSTVAINEAVRQRCQQKLGERLGRMGDISDIPFATLASALDNFLRPETLKAANACISNAIAALTMFRYLLDFVDSPLLRKNV